jgi:hypothetical protein
VIENRSADPTSRATAQSARWQGDSDLALRARQT